MKKVAFATLGCKVNQYDTDVMKASFDERGYSCVNFSDEADIYVVNTCTVTAVAARKSRQMAAKARKTNPGALVVVTGCLGQLESEQVKEMTGADIVTGNVEKSRIVDVIEENENGIVEAADIFRQFEYVQDGESLQDTRTRIYIKVQDGCDNFCSYCAIPFARGRSRSRKPEEVIEEVRTYAGAGAKELVITGIHLDSYGKDLDNSSLIELLEEIDMVGGIERVRLGSLEPASITGDFAERAALLKKLCPHFHLSLQSGCDTVLKRMKRRYTGSEFKEAVKILRTAFDRVSFTTDVIVGFPGETEEEFNESLGFVSDIGFMKVHVFKFSPRKGTLAYGMKDRIPGDVQKARSELMIEKAEASRREYLGNYLGKTVEVLSEQEHPGMPGYWEGYTDDYIKVVFECDGCEPNEAAEVEITEIQDEFVLGLLKT